MMRTPASRGPAPSYCIGCCKSLQTQSGSDFKWQGWYEYKGNDYCKECWEPLYWILRKLVPCPV